MSTTPKKPKARRMWMCPLYSNDVLLKKSMLWGNNKAIPVAVLDVSDPDALIEVAAKEMQALYPRLLYCMCQDSARAALTALGVLPKRRGKHS